MKAKKIAHIFPSPHAGGSELCAMETIQLLGNEMEHHAVFPEAGIMSERVGPYVTDIAFIPYDWWLSAPGWSLLFKGIMLKGYIRSALRIRKYLRMHNIDLVITHTMAIPSAALAAKWSGIPHIWYIHEYGDLDHGFTFNYGKKRMLGFIQSHSAAVLFTSRTLLNHFASFFHAHTSAVLYNAVRYPLRKPSGGKNERTLTICMVGRLAEGKNQMLALQALVLLKNEHIQPHVYLAGSADPDYLRLLQTYILENRLTEQVHIEGSTDTPWEYLYKSDCALVTSTNEAFGRVTVEAMKSGVVPVVSDGGAGKEIIQHGINGFLFESGNPEALAAVLKQLWLSGDLGPVAAQAYEYATVHFNDQIHHRTLTDILKRI